MNGSIIILLLVASLQAEGQNPLNSGDPMNPNNLKERLDYICAVAILIDENIPLYHDVISFFKSGITSYIPDAGSIFDGYIEEMVGMRIILVAEGCSASCIPNYLRDDAKAIVDIIGNGVARMYDELGEMYSQLSEWKNNRLSYEKRKLCDPEINAWFRDKGFSDGTLKDVTVSFVHNHLRSILDGRSCFKRLIEVVSTYIMITNRLHIGDHLIWLFMFSSLLKMNPEFEQKLKKELEVTFPTKSDDILLLTESISDESSTLMHTFGPTSDIGLHYIAYSFTKHAHHSLPLMDLYLSKFLQTCQELPARLYELECTLYYASYTKNDETVFTALNTNGMYVREEGVDYMSYGMKINEIISDTGILGKLYILTQTGESLPT